MWNRRAFAAVCCAVVFAVPAGADRLKAGTTWSELSSKGDSMVFGRLEGRFDGPEFRNRKIEVYRVDNGKEYNLDVDEGLGYFAEILPAGTYQITGVEATYYPTHRPMDPSRYRPVHQRFGVRPKRGGGSPANFSVERERPVYIGTITIDNRPDGIVYRGHYIQVMDEYDEAYERLESVFPRFTTSLSREQITPAQQFMLKPVRRESPLEIVDVEDPIRRAREYIAEHKYQQAINWLQTFMPASDRERNEVRLLIGEAYLGDGKFPESISVIGDVLEADPGNLRALRLLARAHSHNQDTEDAFNLYGALAEYLPDDAEAHLQLGYIYALRAEASRSTDEFNSAFTDSYDYLLYDVTPFLMALKASSSEGSAGYEPPRVIRQRVRLPQSIESKRSSEQGGIAVVIDHKGKVVAARVSPGAASTLPLMLISMINATFKPASLNGVPVPSLLLLGGGGSTSSTQE